MSREIKFRAWCKEYGLPGFMIMPNDFSNDEFITFDGNPIEVVAQEGWFETNGLKYELMQYTGLKDKNGKEIYEGDIYKRYDNIFVVIFDELGFKCKQVYDSWLDKNVYNRNEISLLSKVDSDYCYEVIGNIYDHPHLLEGDSNE